LIRLDPIGLGLTGFDRLLLGFTGFDSLAGEAQPPASEQRNLIQARSAIAAMFAHESNDAQRPEKVLAPNERNERNERKI
jgi:hypothetical protein